MGMGEHVEKRCSPPLPWAMYAPASVRRIGLHACATRRVPWTGCSTPAARMVRHSRPIGALGCRGMRGDYPRGVTGNRVQVTCGERRQPKERAAMRKSPYWRPERFYGVVEIKSECGADDGTCDGAAVGGFPMLTRENSVGMWWLCASHASAVPDVPAAEVFAGARVQEVTRTCAMEDERGTPCGAVATHVAIVGVHDQLGNPEVGIVSVCSGHADTEEWVPQG